MALFDRAWMESWRRLVNADEGLQVIGRYFTADLIFSFGDTSYLVSIKNGAIEQIREGTGNAPRDGLAFRGARDVWEQFVQPMPPPRYNGIFPLVFGKLLIMEGDEIVFWQNLRALTVMTHLMRTASR
ncbi:MAG: hypothetical protein HY268_10695 [Deltaproteobacteria bacterium]|nr:hypothetical protein [Deltaproteobacteria bacterium]